MIIVLLFIAIAVVAAAAVRWDNKKVGFCGDGEQSSWGNWVENTERENFATSGCSSDGVDDPFDGLEVYRQHRRRRHGGGSHFCGGVGHAGADVATALLQRQRQRQRQRQHERFSPDVPGTCSRKLNRAAQAELDALRVAAGL